MADKQETIEDIVGDIRAQNQGLPEDATALSPLVCDLLSLADRLEAAHKRELSKNAFKNKADFGQLGDAAKLREALKLCVDEMCDRCRELAVARGNPLPCLSGCEPVRKAKAALSAPPRNCDLPEVAKDPWRAWLDDKSNWDEFGSPKLEIHDWLLAPATEKEGGAE